MSSCMVGGFHCFDGIYSFHLQGRGEKMACNIAVGGKKQLMEDRIGQLKL
jgi:hypothetical protein